MIYSDGVINLIITNSLVILPVKNFENHLTFDEVERYKNGALLVHIVCTGRSRIPWVHELRHLRMEKNETLAIGGIHVDIAVTQACSLYNFLPKASPVQNADYSRL